MRAVGIRAGIQTALRSYWENMLRDNFTAQLKCPECGRTGVARLSQADSHDWMQGDRGTKIDSLPQGFTSINRKTWLASDVDIVCTEHDVSALVKP